MNNRYLIHLRQTSLAGIFIQLEYVFVNYALPKLAHL